MKVKRIICPVCGAERQSISEEENLYEYSEEIVSETCPEHENTPEERLLGAIFRKGGE